MVSHTKFQVFMSIHSLMRNFCKIDRGGWLYSEFEVALWCHIPISGLKVNLLSHEEFLQKLIGVGGRDCWIWGGSVVSHTKFQVFMSICSLIRSFCKIVRGGGAGGDGWILGGTPVSHTKFQVSMSIRSLIRSFCQIENDEKSSFFISFSSKNDDFTI